MGSVYDILVNHLEYRKISSRWAPNNLTQAQKSVRLSGAHEQLRIYQHADLRRLSEICTGEETLVKHAEPLIKGQNKHGSLKVQLLAQIPGPISAL